MNEGNILLTIVGALALGVVFLFQKYKNAKAVNDNVATKEQVLDLEKKVATEEAKNTTEEVKRSQLKADLEENKQNDLDNEELKKFLLRELERDSNK